MMRPASNLFRVVLLGITFAIATPASSVTFEEAYLSYQNGDLEQASEQFLSLAKLGHANSQFNLAIMYLNGQGVDEDQIIGIGWLLSAKSHGYDINDDVVSRATSSLSPAQLREARGIVDSFGANELGKSLLNNSFFSCFRKPPTIRQFAKIEYPFRASDSELDAVVWVNVTVGASGIAYDPRVTLKAPPNEKFGFESAAIESALNSRYSPAIADAQQVEGQRNVIVYFSHENGRLWNLDFFTEVKQRVIEDGVASPYDKYILGTSALLDMSLNISEKDAYKMVVDAAQYGYAPAQSLLAYKNIERGDCASDVTNTWMDQAADNGSADGMLYIARESLSSAQPDIPSVMELLETAAELALENEIKDEYLFRHLSSIFSASPIEQIRKPRLALELAKEISQGGNANPHAQEVLSAAWAVNGSFRKAIRSQKRAISKAEDLFWNTSLMEQRLTAWENGEQWYGDLFSLPESTQVRPEITREADTCDPDGFCRDSAEKDTQRAPTGSRIIR